MGSCIWGSQKHQYAMKNVITRLSELGTGNRALAWLSLLLDNGAKTNAGARNSMPWYFLRLPPGGAKSFRKEHSRWLLGTIAM
jgi:hypothetical protein